MLRFLFLKFFLHMQRETFIIKVISNSVFCKSEHMQVNKNSDEISPHPTIKLFIKEFEN